MYNVISQRWAGKAGLRRLMANLDASGEIRRTLTLRSGPKAPPRDPHDAMLLEKIGGTKTGVVAFIGDNTVTAVIPPVSLAEDHDVEGADIAPLVAMLDWKAVVGVILLRLGHYAVGVLENDKLVTSKSDSRYVKSRHRAGGSSQRRFERSRERLVRELFDRCCEVTQRIFGPYESRLDVVAFGGERHTLNNFRKRCAYTQRFSGIAMERILQVKRPGKIALEGMADEVWKSRIIILERTLPQERMID